MDWSEVDPEEDEADLKDTQEVLATLAAEGSVPLSEVLSDSTNTTASEEVAIAP